MSFARRIGLGAGVAFVIPIVLAGIAWFSYHSTLRRMNEISTRRRARTMGFYLERLTVDMETAIRGYRLNGDPAFLGPFQTAVREYGPTAGEVRALLSDGRSKDLLKSILASVDDYRLSWAEPVIAFIASHPPAIDGASVTVVRSPAALSSSEGKRRMDAIRAQFDDFLAFEERRIGTDLGEVTRAQKRLGIVFLGTAAASSILLVVGAFLLLSDYRKRSVILFAGIDAGEQGTYAPVALEGQDELAQITRAFNRMTEEVQRRDEELRNTVDELTATNHELSTQQRALIDSQQEILKAESRARLKAEEAERARLELDRFFSVSLDLFCIAGFDGFFKKVNSAWTRTLGYSARELTATPYLEFIHPDDRIRTGSEAGSNEEGNASISFENRYRRKDGSFRWLEWNAVPVPDEALIYAAARDVTSRHVLEQDLRRQKDELAEVNRELESFSYSVSHDLRAPLRAIDGFSQILLEDFGDKLGETGRDSLDRIRAATKRMSSLIDDLLGLARVTRADLKREVVDVSALVRSILADLSVRNPDHRVEAAIEEGIRVSADPGLLRVVMENLLGNAWKFTAKIPRPKIEFGRKESSDGIQLLFVKDNGAGFDMTYADKLFKAFQRLHDATEFPGTGIGLATVSRIVRRHGGRVSAEGSIGRGATVSFTLGQEPAT